jgi:hypothetical protein
MLDHATISITMDLYSHTTPGMHHQAAESMAALLS